MRHDVFDRQGTYKDDVRKAWTRLKQEWANVKVRPLIAGDGDFTPRYHVETDDHSRPTWEVWYAAKGKLHILNGWPAILIRLGIMFGMALAGFYFGFISGRLLA